MVAAIAASRVRPHSVILLEKEARVGRKLLATGNGRCNLLNMNISSGAYHGSGSAAALSLLDKMPPEWLLSYFSELGLLCREESEGRCYPHSGQAASVLDALRFSLDRYGVEIRQNAEVQRICREDDRKTCREELQNADHEKEGFLPRPMPLPVAREREGFALHLASSPVIHAKRVVFAAGGKAAPSFGADGSAFQMMTALGHTLIPLRPALVPLKVPADRIRGLKGIRVHGEAALLIDGRVERTETGEILFTEYGLSGIAAMSLSRSAGDALLRKQQKHRVEICLRLLDRQTAFEEMRKRLSLFSGETMESVFTGILPKRIGLCLLREVGIAPGETVTEAAVQSVFALCSEWVLPVTGVLAFQNAQVTAGGLDFGEFHQDMLESKIVPGLYACGEALDVDGNCGGYNLMWAWVSGITAGESVIRSL